MKVLAIQNYGTSGSLLLHSLLDGHPNFCLTPALESLWLYPFWSQFLEHHPLRWETVLNGLVQAFPHWFDPQRVNQDHGLHQLGPNRDEAAVVDQNLFEKHFLEQAEKLGECTRRNFMLAVHLAYHASLDRNPEEVTYLVFPAHSQPIETIRQLISDFPETRFLHTLRDPINNYASSARSTYGSAPMVNAVEVALRQLLDDHHLITDRPLRGMRPYWEGVRGQTRGLKLESLHERPQATLENLCHWLGIPFHPALLSSTFNGKAWWNRPQAAHRVSGFSQAIPQQRFDEVINSFDRYRLGSLMAPLQRGWGYPVRAAGPLQRWAGLVWLLWPLKAEIRLARKPESAYWSVGSLARRLLSRPAPPVTTFAPFNGVRRAPTSWAEKLLARWAWVTCPLWWARDYLRVRQVLYRAWWRGTSTRQDLVALLSSPEND